MTELGQMFRKAGGLALLRQYWRAGVLPHALAAGLVLGPSRKGLELLRLSVARRVQQRLRRRYAGLIASHRAQQPAWPPADAAPPGPVWVCWLQGIEQAPPLVQRCHRSLAAGFPGRQIVLLTDANLGQYLQLPPHVQARVDSGAITRTHLSDLMRLELLHRHGGTWIDATVMCGDAPLPAYMQQADLFLFQNLKPGRDGHSINVSSWFITARAGHPVIGLARALMHAYWQTHDSLVDYFLVHHFIHLAAEAYPEAWRRVVPFSNAPPHILQLMFFEPFDAERWQHVQAMTPVHKLTYKFDPALARQPGTYHDRLVRQAGAPVP